MGNRDASMKVGSADSSGEAGARHTKCRISAADVPIYKFSSNYHGQLQNPSGILCNSNR